MAFSRIAVQMAKQSAKEREYWALIQVGQEGITIEKLSLIHGLDPFGALRARPWLEKARP